MLMRHMSEAVLAGASLGVGFERARARHAGKTETCPIPVRLGNAECQFGFKSRRRHSTSPSCWLTNRQRTGCVGSDRRRRVSPSALRATCKFAESSWSSISAVWHACCSWSSLTRLSIRQWAVAYPARVTAAAVFASTIARFLAERPPEEVCDAAPRWVGAPRREGQTGAECRECGLPRAGINRTHQGHPLPTLA